MLQVGAMWRSPGIQPPAAGAPSEQVFEERMQELTERLEACRARQLKAPVRLCGPCAEGRRSASPEATDPLCRAESPSYRAWPSTSRVDLRISVGSVASGSSNSASPAHSPSRPYSAYACTDTGATASGHGVVRVSCQQPSGQGFTPRFSTLDIDEVIQASPSSHVGPGDPPHSAMPASPETPVVNPRAGGLVWTLPSLDIKVCQEMAVDPPCSMMSDEIACIGGPPGGHRSFSSPPGAGTRDCLGPLAALQRRLVPGLRPPEESRYRSPPSCREAARAEDPAQTGGIRQILRWAEEVAQEAYLDLEQVCPNGEDLSFEENSFVDSLNARNRSPGAARPGAGPGESGAEDLTPRTRQLRRLRGHALGIDEVLEELGVPDIDLAIRLPQLLRRGRPRPPRERQPDHGDRKSVV